MNISECMQKRGGFVTETDLAEIIKEDRFAQLIIRCGCGRMIVAAQDCQHFIDIIEREKSDYIRDVSFSASYVPPKPTTPKPAKWPAIREYYGDGSEYGGVWNGHEIISDATPGL